LDCPIDVEVVAVLGTPVLRGRRFLGGDGSATPVVCRAASSLSSLLTLVVVEAGTSCRSSIVAWWKKVAPVGGNQAIGVNAPVVAAPPACWLY
jgi:hypothetical protein